MCFPGIFTWLTGQGRTAVCNDVLLKHTAVIGLTFCVCLLIMLVYTEHVKCDVTKTGIIKIIKVLQYMYLS